LISKVPAPPLADSLDPAIITWESGVPIYRAHGRQHDAISFNRKQGLDFRFSSLTIDGQPVGILYGADSLIGAISETMFHTIPSDGDRLKPRTISRTIIEKYAISIIASHRPLRLIDLTGHGIGREGMPITYCELISSEAAHYADTRAWAEMFHRHPSEVDGFIWVSRQYNIARAMMLFEDRVEPNLLFLAEDTALAGRSPMIEIIETAAMDARIIIIN
jgi:hypothetical protein